MSSFQPLFDTRVPRILHGADYNPDQWLHRPDIIDDDFRLMKLARCSVMSVGIFAWAALEPREGEFRFEWLDNVMDRLADSGMYACLATPTGARPRWLSGDYPETNRVGPDRVRALPGGRHNHNYSSPVMKEKTTIINTKLAERYGSHPALLLWHVSNEYGGEDHSDLSQDAFREWLKVRYNNDLDLLNRAWWTSFWSRTYQNWSQIESPAPHGEQAVHGLALDWKRFVTHQTVEFMKHEVAPLKRITPEVPVTTNFMGTYPGLDYFRFSDVIDIASWDSYPRWHHPHPLSNGTDGLEDYYRAAEVAFCHDLTRSFRQGRPFMLMESTPSMTNWQPYAKLKRPGMHRLSSLQAVAHGADTVQYFQWRKSRGSFEKLHGAVVDHCGHEHTRVFGDVAQLGDDLQRIAEIGGAGVPAEVAILFDWDNRWALEEAKGPRNDDLLAYEQTVIAHYRAFWSRGVPVDVVDGTRDLSRYKIVVAPMLYMLKPGFAEKVEQHVAAGGVFVATYWSGIVDEHDLCFLGGFPGPLRTVLGIWSEEIDALAPGETCRCRFIEPNELDLHGAFETHALCDLVHLESAEQIAVYDEGFPVSRPALTVNTYGTGRAYYLAGRTTQDALDAFYASLLRQTPVERAIDRDFPPGVAASLRVNETHRYVFLQNYSDTGRTVELAAPEAAPDAGPEAAPNAGPDAADETELQYTEMLAGVEGVSRVELEPFGVAVVRTTV